MNSLNESVSIVLLFYHRDPESMPDNYDPHMLLDCIDSIIKNTQNYELICIDNGSTADESWVKEFADKYIKFDKNMGIANGWNTGILNAKHDKVIILSDDTVVGAGWSDAMLNCFQNKDCGVACPQVEGMPYGDKLKEIWSWFPGACFMLSKSRTVKKVGFFDWQTFFPCNWEDADMWVRVMAHGLKLYTNPKAYVQHRMGATLHVHDLSSPFELLRKEFIKKHGFDCQQYLYGDKNIKEVLHLVNKTIIKPNFDLHG